MQYSFETLTLLLYRLQSSDFHQYKDYTEADVLILLLCQEQIIDYTQIEWQALWQSLYENRDYELPFGDGGPYRIVVGNKLEVFINRIIPREERIRILAFLRDNAQHTLFKDAECTNVCDFRKECARLISHNVEESKYDEYHGEFADMPRPNLRAIATGVKLQELTPQDKIIAQYMPTYQRNIGAFPPEVILPVAHHCVNTFLDNTNAFRQTREESDKPCMSPQNYTSLIRDLLIRQANRYLHFNNEPIYQVLWTMCVLLRFPHKSCWWRDKFVEGIIAYLNCTRYFSNTKQQMDDALRTIEAQTGQQSIFPEMKTNNVTAHGICQQPPVLPQTELIANLLKQLKEHSDATINVNVVAGDMVHEKYVQNEIDNVSPNAVGVQYNQTK